ncbi:hypothetical protein [Ornithinimicrobium flavum]|uniref:hypothetical protein n=1 Tax=Ornithinimicrobium flavum TaxID=1288636 RepID=UPI00106FB16D|nr:hypothetical protein [Ornithinimicrobium flavum]
MTRLVVKMNDRGAWEVFDDTGQSLFSGERLRAEGFARRLCAAAGGTVTVVSRTGEQLGQYRVAPWTAPSPTSTKRRTGTSERRRRR